MATSSPYDGEPTEPAPDEDNVEITFVRARTLPAPPLDSAGQRRLEIRNYVIKCFGAAVLLVLVYGVLAPAVGRFFFNKLLGVRIPWILDFVFIGLAVVAVAGLIARYHFRRKTQTPRS